MSLLWALPVMVLVAGTALAGLLLARLGGELTDLDLSLRRAGRVGVAADSLRTDVAGLHATAAGIAGRTGGTSTVGDGPVNEPPPATGRAADDR